MNDIEAKLSEFGLELPAAPAAAGNYLPFRIAGNILITSGMVAMKNGEMTHVGAVGGEQTVETGYEAARVCTLNALAVIKDALGGFERIEQFVSVAGFVNSVNGFTQTPQVINGASDLLGELFGDIGKHARTAVSTNGLPLDSTVEVQVTVQLKPEEVSF